MLDYKLLKESFDNTTFFKDKTWEISPSPLLLSPEIEKQIIDIGDACFDFLKSIHKLYYTSKNSKSILRNKKLTLPWISDYFERGKNAALINHFNNKSFKNIIPSIIRPDLLLTNEGLIMSELEVVAGGIGFTAFLHRIYETHYDQLIGGSLKMLEGFYHSLAKFAGTKEFPTIAILVSEESDTYQPELLWLAKELRKTGKKVYAISPNVIRYENSKLTASYEDNIIEIDIIYRFFELFDIQNIQTAKAIMQANEDMNVIISPPLNTIYEEKLCFGLFHHYQLDEYWKESLSKKSLEILKKIIPNTWIIDSQPFGPNAMLNGPWINNKPLGSWDELSNASQKNRNYVIKRSGYHEEAWGSRSIIIGNDCSQETWADGIHLAIKEDKTSLFIIQEFKKPKKFIHPIYDNNGIIVEKFGRVRLCPYYMEGNKKSELCGILATICPADKKIIHGMSAGTFVPCNTLTYITR